MDLPYHVPVVGLFVEGNLSLDLLEFSGTGCFFNGLYAKDSRSITGSGEMELLKSLRILEACPLDGSGLTSKRSLNKSTFI